MEGYSYLQSGRSDCSSPAAIQLQVRYASSGRGAKKRAERWDKTAIRNRNAAIKLYQSARDLLNSDERDYFDLQIDAERRAVDEAQEEWDKADGSLFFRQMKVDSWFAKWPQRQVMLSEETLRIAEQLDSKAKKKTILYEVPSIQKGKFRDGALGVLGTVAKRRKVPRPPRRIQTSTTNEAGETERC
jgi:hypothetical protein